MLKEYYLKISGAIGNYSIWIIGIIHFVGIIGLISPAQEFFRLLTPFNLIFCAFILWINHKENHKELISFSLFVFALGYAIEWLGVHYGIIFGSYYYGKTLGPTIMEVPIIIGLNWLLVMYCVATLTDSLKIPVLIKIILASFLAVAIDWLIEPVAMHYDFWHWKNNVVPVQNYLGWFITSFIMQSGYHLFKVKSENKIGLSYYFIQLSFFLILNLAIRIS